MKKENVIQKKSYQLALRIIQLYKYLASTRTEYILSKQILRSGTSIGANVEEALGASSKKDFIHKLTISYKEARETHYWLRLLKDSDFINSKMSISLIDDCEEIMKIIGSIQKTMKGRY